MTIAPNTHLEIDHELCGNIVALREGYAEVALQTTPRMAADARGLVHGGFVFGAADYAAMLAVNDPNVVLGASESRFVAPVVAGQQVHIVAQLQQTSGKRRIIEAHGKVDGRDVFKATFTAFVLEQHVLDA